MTRRTLLAASLAIVAAAGAASTLSAAIGVEPAESRPPRAERHMAGPPWISIEYPPSPYDRATRDAFLLVHAYHHATPADFPVSGRAEGVVDGKRRTVELQFGLVRRSLKAALAGHAGLGTHDADGHLIVIRGAHGSAPDGNG